MTKTQAQKIQHYRVYMKMYGQMIMELADSDEAVFNLIANKNRSPFATALKTRIEKSPVCDELHSLMF